MTEQAGKTVPAVRNALAILEYLRAAGNEPRTMSEIARATSINTSTCFNILKTLHVGGVLSLDPSTKTYRLGLYLAELGALVDEHREGMQQVMAEARLVAAGVGLGCFVMGRTERGEFVVLDKVDSSHPIHVTIDVGTTFPPTGAVAVKAWLAWQPNDVVDAYVRTHGLPAHTPHSIVDVQEFSKELDRVREQGYATSVSEYYPDHNAVASPVFGSDARPRYLLVVVGTRSQLAGGVMASVGEETARAATRATKRIAGRGPAWREEGPSD